MVIHPVNMETGPRGPLLSARVEVEGPTICSGDAVARVPWIARESGSLGTRMVS